MDVRDADSSLIITGNTRPVEIGCPSTTGPPIYIIAVRADVVASTCFLYALVFTCAFSEV
jgi:hypothetical protein